VSGAPKKMNQFTANMPSFPKSLMEDLLYKAGSKTKYHHAESMAHSNSDSKISIDEGYVSAARYFDTTAENIKEERSTLFTFYEESIKIRNNRPLYRRLKKIIDSHILSNRLEPDIEILLRLSCAIAGSEILPMFNKIKRRQSRLISKNVIADFLTQSILIEAKLILTQTLIFEIDLMEKNEFFPEKDLENYNISKEIISQIECDDFLEYITEKYIVMRPRLVQRFTVVIEQAGVVCKRLTQDIVQIREVLNYCTFDTVRKFRLTESDPHMKGGRVVMVYGNCNNIIVYKPRSLKGELEFSKIVSWYNSNNTGFKLRSLEALDRGDYGWMGHAENKNIANPSEVSKYYNRYGQLVHLLYILGTSDIHYENLVASGEQPLIVDLETLFHPRTYQTLDGSNQIFLNLDYLQDTPFYSCLVDLCDFFSEQNGSPLSIIYDEAQISEISKKLRNKLCLHIPTAGTNDCINLPRINGNLVSHDEYKKDILDGIEASAIIIIENKLGILSILEEMKKSISGMRVIFRFTRFYRTILDQLYSPYSLQSFEKGEECLHYLWKARRENDLYLPVLPAEWVDLWRGDIPYFSTYSDGERIGILDSQGRRWDDLITEHSVDIAKARVLLSSRKNVDDQKRSVSYALTQKTFIRRSRISQDIPPNIDEKPFGNPVNNPEQYLSALLSCIEIENGHANFVDIRSSRSFNKSAGVVDYSIYTGIGGMLFSALFADNLSSDAKEKRYRLAQIVLPSMLSDAKMEIGACYGIGGAIWLSGHVANSLNIKEAVYFGKTACSIARSLIYRERHYDIFSGTSGAILGATSFYNMHPDASVLDSINDFSDHLLSQSISYDDRRVWHSSIPSKGPTSGFAHGVSGIGYSLLRAYEVTGRNDLLSASTEAANFVLDCFDSNSHGFKEDLFDEEVTNHELWCHGTPGIFLFLQALKNHLPDWNFRNLYDKIKNKSLTSCTFENDSLCHGSLGNIDLFIDNDYIHNPDRQIPLKILHEIGSRSFICGNENNTMSHSLFTGMSGAAYQSLRARSEGKMPSVLRFT